MAQANTPITVNSTGDAIDSIVGDGICETATLGECTLRAAIEEANAVPATLDTITFDIPGAGPHTIQPASALPTITDPVIIDGYTQLGASANTNDLGSGSNAILMVELDGSNAGDGVDGLTITGGGSTVRGLAIDRFQGSQTGDGILLSVNGGNVVEGNFIGTDLTGTTDEGNRGAGVRIDSGDGNRIGGTTAGARNVISGNDFGGVNVRGGTNHLIVGNYIGLNAAGAASVGNSFGVGLVAPSAGNRVGGTALGEGNVISGNTSTGLIISGSDDNVVQGNFIGTDPTGTVAIGNLGTSQVPGKGISLTNGAANNLIGGTTAEARNIISGNRNGIRVASISSPTNGNRIHGNYIGTDVTGMVRLANSGSGILLDQSASYIQIGGTGAGEGNLISGNGTGVSSYNNSGYSSNTGNLIEGNLIGTDATGTGALSNSTGVSLSIGTDNTTIGGTTPGARNVISGNGTGVRIVSINAKNNLVQGNYIGTDVTGVGALGNTGPGVAISSSSAARDNTIGGTAAGAGNTIAFNDVGVQITGSTTYGDPTGNAILGNAIYSNTNLGIDLGSDGVTANDAGDPDTGPNNLQNFPILTSAVADSGTTTIEGTLNSTSSTIFQLEFFSNTACDPSGNGEGENFLGATNVTTDGGEDGSFTFLTNVPNGEFVTATATDPAGNTSEFAECVEVVALNSAPIADAGGPYTVFEGGTVILSGSGSDPEGDPLTYSWDLDNDGAFETAGQDPIFSAVGRTGPDSQTVVLQVCDPQGLCGTDGTSVAILVLPDLVIESFTHSPASPTSEDTITFTAVVKNVGGSEAGPSILNFRIGGETFGEDFAIPALSPGESEARSRAMKLSIPGGYINHVTADVYDDVTESAETNNDAEDRYVVLDVTPPTLSVDAITAPQDGFLPEKTISVSDQDALGTSPVQVSGSVTDDRRMPIETNVTIDVSGTAAPVDTEGAWSATILLESGPNLITVSATDFASNLTSTVFEILLDLDLDDDGIRNNIDTLPSQASTLFSDSSLGGNTSGNVEPVDPAVSAEFLIEDAPAPDGLIVGVEALSGYVKVDLDCSTGSYLFGPGTYVLTCNTVTLEVVSGVAEVEYSIGESTIVVIVDAGSTVTLTETIGGDGELLELDIAVDTGSATVNGEPLTPGQSVNLILPLADAGGPYGVDEGDVITLDASGSSDPNGGPLIAAWDLDSNGSFETPGLSPTFSAIDLDGPSSQVVVVEVCNAFDICATDQATVDILNVAPAVTVIALPMDPVQIGAQITGSAAFTDPGVLDTHTSEWDWGDGTTSTGTIVETAGSGMVMGSHTYTANGIYTVNLTVTDDDGGVGVAEYRYVVVYDPEGGFVTGGGWIDSPMGAYGPDPLLSGKATFGFVSKYKKGADLPTGQAQFQFRVADLNFHSDTYDWLVVAGSKAQFKGIGTINGTGEYKFILTAIDAALNENDAHTVDKFRIKIWTEEESGIETVVYDNGLGAEEYSDAATELGGGSIVIHKAKK